MQTLLLHSRGDSGGVPGRTDRLCCLFVGCPVSLASLESVFHFLVAAFWLGGR